MSNFVPLEQVYSGIKCPLELVLCQKCTLVQLRHTAPQDFLYTRHYWYVSGRTDTMKAALRDVAAYAESLVDLKKGDVVCDVGSNDGTLLRSYTNKDVLTVGVEPATNLREHGADCVDVFINEFWSAAAFLDRVGKRAKVITAVGMLYDTDDPNAFIHDVSLALADDGVFIAQLMCLKNMIALNDVGNICHEHVSFYSLKSLEYLLARHELKILDISTNNVNGESYRLTIGKSHRPYPPYAAERVTQAFQAEEGLDQPAFYAAWFGKLEENRRAVVSFIRREVARGKRVFILGASTKGSVICQWMGLDHTLIEGASERSENKVGLYTVGTGIPIYSEETAREAKPDYFLVLPYAFANEIMEREAAFRERGGRFVVPLPELKVV